jgi:hypothetical protein
MTAHLTGRQYREVLDLAARLLDAIGTPPIPPFNLDPDARRAWHEQMGVYCGALGRLHAALDGAAGRTQASDPIYALRAFRATVAAYEHDPAAPGGRVTAAEQESRP